MKNLLLIAGASLILSGCVSTNMNIPNPTATEQLLVSHAAERAAAGLDLKLKPDTKVYLETNVASSTPAMVLTPTVSANDRYVIEAVKAHLIGRGLILVANENDAEVIVSLRILADSIDDMNRVFGVPATTIPNFSAGSGVAASINIPEMALFSEHQRSGIVELSATAVNSKTGKLVSAVGNIFAVSKIVNQHILTGFIFGDELARPGIRAQIAH